MKLEQLTKCGACGRLTALSDKVACKLCKLEREREYQEQVLAQALARVTAIQDTLRGIAWEEATYRGQVINAQLSGGN